MEVGLSSHVLEERELRRSVQKLYDRGLYLQAYETSRRHGPLAEWTGPEWRILGGRLAGNLGAPRLGSRHLLRAWRESPGHAEAAWYYARHLLDARGPLRGWNWMRRQGEFPEADTAVRAHWLSLHAHALARLRDFDAAEEWLARAEALQPDLPWVLMEKAFLLRQEDRPEEALEVARHSLHLRPWYRPGVQETGHLLVQLGRDEEALALLQEASEHLESNGVVAQLLALRYELEQYAEAGRDLEAFAHLSPLMEKMVMNWFQARRSDIAYHVGDLAGAVEFAGKIEEGFHKDLVARLTSPPADPRRVLLPVPFVRQDYHTCVPATLVAISRFWSMPADHLEIAAEICFEGTTHTSERRWAEEHGWIAREFTVTWEAARSLLDRGIPFTLTTLDPAGGHLQAVIGYDDRRGTLFVRDPSDRHRLEIAVERFLAHQASTGPRGMALVPKEHAARLADVELPDAPWYDLLHALQLALLQHDRAAAAEAMVRLEQEAGEHYVRWQARRALAQYDLDHLGLLECAERMLARHPECPYWQTLQVHCLRQMSRQIDRRARLEELVGRRSSHPLLWQMYAGELAQDARDHGPALHWLRRAHRFLPADPVIVSEFACIRWDQGRFEEGLELYRFAACLSDKFEDVGRRHFIAARNRGRTEEVLEFLRRRYDRLGKQSVQPTRTLFWALAQLDRHQESFALLADALIRRPDDGELLLFIADMHGQYGRFRQAAAFLERARNKVKKTAWDRAAAYLASAQGNLAQALEIWQGVLAAEPLALDAVHAVTGLLADTRGKPAAQEHLAALCARFPHHHALGQLRIEWMRDQGPVALEPVVREHLAHHPADAWAQRELALTAAAQGRIDEALAAIEVAEALEPNNPGGKAIRGHILNLAGRRLEARQPLQDALALSIDYDFAARELLLTCETLAERREMLKFLEQELVRQRLLGEGLSTFRELAQANLEADEVLALLRRGLQARPDLWQAWSALVQQLAFMEKREEALDVARAATEKFPLQPALWLDLAQVYRDREEVLAEIGALRKALEIVPGHGLALRRLSQAHEDLGDVDEAHRVLDAAIAFAPLVAANHLALAEWWWRQNKGDEALERVQHALFLDPGLEAGWVRLQEWSVRMDGGRTSRRFARQLAERRPGEVRSWLVLARSLTAPEETTECLQAIDRALALRPSSLEANDLRAEVLTMRGAVEEALQACRPPVFGDEPPLLLQGREAWVLWQAGRQEEALRRMEECVARDPNYLWAWTNLADWYQARAAWDPYLRAAEAMCRLEPRSALALAYRGEARLRLGQHEQARADLQAALRIAPAFAMPGLLLFDDLMRTEELDEARRVLAILQEHGGDANIQARTIVLFARADKRQEAFDALRKLLVDPSANPFAIDQAIDALDRAGWGQELPSLLEECAAEPGCHFQAVVALVDRWPVQAAEDLERRLDLVDRILEPLPHRLIWKIHDVRADLLARTGRFEEALAACAPPELQPPPVYLRGRRAWVEHLRGRRQEAIRIMLGCVEEDPNYWWAWSCLAQWYDEIGRHRDFHQAAQAMTRLAPGDPFAQVQLGQACRKLGRRAEARQAFAQALEAAPNYRFPAEAWFEVCLEDEDFAGAEIPLQKLREQGEPPEYWFHRLRLTLRRGQRNKVGQRFTDLARRHQGRTDLVEEALALLQQAGWVREAELGLRGALGESGPLGDAWARAMAADKGSLPSAADITSLFPPGPARNHALTGTLVLAARIGKLDALHDLLRRHGPELKVRVEDWGTVGYALATAEDWQGTIDWMADWTEREGVAPWMLDNLGDALRISGMRKEADRLARHVVEEMPPDHSLPLHQIWLAADEVLEMDPAAGGERWHGIDATNLRPYYRFLHLIVGGVVRMREAPPAERGAVYRRLRRELVEAAAQLGEMRHDPELLRIYRGCLRAVASLQGGLEAWLWSRYRSWNPLLPRRGRN